MGKILVFISIAVSLATAILGFVNKGKLDASRQASEAVAQEKAKAEQALQASEKSLKGAKDELATAAAEKEQALSQAQAAQAAADQAKSKLSEIESQIEQKAGEISKLTTDIQAKQAEIDQLKAAPAAPSGPSEDVVAKLAEQETLITKLQGDLDTAKAQAQELKTEKANRMASKMRDGLQGRVLAVNRAWNFVVLSLGDKNGVVNNAEMLVKRGNNLIGRVRITAVEPNSSIADIDLASVPQGLEIAPGDNVIFRSVGELN